MPRHLDREMMNEDFDHHDSPHYSGYCRDCGKYVQTVTEDHGIGAYEFWGARGVDKQLVEVCPECGGSVEEMAGTPCNVCLFEVDDFECAKGRDTSKLDTGDTCPQWEPGRQRF